MKARSFKASVWGMNVVILCLAATMAKATVLDFSINNNPADTPYVNFGTDMSVTFTDYGDNVSSTSVVSGTKIYHYGQGYGFTPNISVGYSAASGYVFQYYHENSGFLDQVGYLPGTVGASKKFYVEFAPDAGYGVRINSFNLMGYGGPIQTKSGTWRILDGSTNGVVLDSGSFGPTIGAFGNQTVFFTAAQEYMNTVFLEINHTVGSSDFAIDNINFDQVIPEPSALVLLAVGFLFLRRRR